MNLVSRVLLTLLLSSPLVCIAATEASADPQPTEVVIRRTDGSIGAVLPTDPSLPAQRVSMLVEPNVVGLARRPQALTMPLSKGKSLVVAMSRFDPREGFSVDDAGAIVVSDDPTQVSYFWYGQSGDITVFITVVRGRMSVLVHGPDLLYTINDFGGLRHIYRELVARDADAGRCGSEEVSKRLNWIQTASNPLLTSPITVNSVGPRPTAPAYTARATILFYYTDAALQQYSNDVGALTATADALIDQLNQSLINTRDTYYYQFSRASSLQYVGSYVEQPTSPPVTDPYQRFTNHLYAVKNQDSANTPSRSTEGADLAVLLVNDVGEPTLPVYGASILQRADCANTVICQIGANGYRDWAYAAVSVNPLVANFTFSHEVSHMLGGQHDINAAYPPPSQGAFSYSYGYRVSGVARDIMADPQCITVSGVTTCTTRQPQYANPKAVFIGTSTASGTSTRDVATTIRMLAEGTGNIYPLTDSQSAPDIFWDDFEY